MARATTRLLLPTELLVKIFQYCEEYDWPDDPHAEHLVMPQFSDDWDGNLTWLRVARSSKDDICNLRLVCRQLREASVASFGWVLSDRVFRLTKSDLQELQDIAAVSGLPQWIKTLTFGSADVNERQIDFEVLLDCSKRDENMHQMLLSIDQAWKKYQRLSSAEVMQGLREPLKVFLQLENLRMIVQDEPRYLKGWLTEEQWEYLDTNFKADAQFWNIHYMWYELGTFFYRSHGLDVAQSVLGAFSDVGGCLWDLKLSILDDYFQATIHDKLLYLLPRTLCSLRLCINWDHFEAIMEDGDIENHSGEFFRALGNLVDLQDLALYLTDHDYEVHWTDQLFQALRKTSKLRHLVLKGRWTLSPTSLVEFVDRDAPTLRSLTLEGCLLDGEYLTTLHSLAAVTRGRLEYLRIWHLSEPNGLGPGAYFESVTMNMFLQSAWPDFACTTNFGPGFELMPDSDEEEDNSIPEGGELSPEDDGDGDHRVEAAGDEGDTGEE